MTWIIFLQPELSAAVTTGKVWLFLLVHQMQVKSCIKYRRENRQSQFYIHAFGFMHMCVTAVTSPEVFLLADWRASSCRRTTGWGTRWPKFKSQDIPISLDNQVDRLAQDFSLASKEESVEAIGIGEQMLELMNRLGFSPSVTWPGYLRLTELLLKVSPP